MLDRRRARSAACLRPRPRTGLAEPSQDQVLRNQAVGSTCSVSASGPALVTEIVISRSSGSALA